MKSKRIFSFDFIRVTAMLLIIVFHYNAYLDVYRIDTSRLLFLHYANGTMGHIGVSLFFILSGASLMYAHREHLEPKQYFKKRFLSIFPIYWLTYAAFFVHFYVLNRQPLPLPLSRLLLSVIGMDGYLYYKIPSYYLVGEWFVGCIILVYLVFPLLWLAVRRWPRRTAVCALLLFTAWVWLYPFEMEIDHFFLSRLPEVMIGMYFVQLFLARPDFPGPLLTAAALAVLLLLLFIPLALPLPWLIVLVGAPAFLLLFQFGCLLEQGPLPWLFSDLAAASFGIFLVHHILQPRFLAPRAGLSLSFGANHWLFLRYFVFTCLVGFLFFQLSRLLLPLLPGKPSSK